MAGYLCHRPLLLRARWVILAFASIPWAPSPGTAQIAAPRATREPGLSGPVRLDSSSLAKEGWTCQRGDVYPFPIGSTLYCEIPATGALRAFIAADTLGLLTADEIEWEVSDSASLQTVEDSLLAHFSGKYGAPSECTIAMSSNRPLSLWVLWRTETGTLLLGSDPPLSYRDSVVLAGRIGLEWRPGPRSCKEWVYKSKVRM